ncbi:hypothetical protein RFA60_000182 [Vibrio parahaemolyticus]|nr:hypothetical protein [Vibrio parahaemolyticus]
MRKISLFLTFAAISTISTFANANNSVIDCEDLAIDVKLYGTSDLNGLRFHAKDELGRMVPRSIDFSFGSNMYVNIGSGQFDMYDVEKNGDTYTFTTTKEKNALGEYIDYDSAYMIQLKDLGNGMYDIDMFEADYIRHTIDNRELFWTPFDQFYGGEELKTPVRFEIDENSVEMRDNFKCVN